MGAQDEKERHGKVPLGHNCVEATGDMCNIRQNKKGKNNTLYIGCCRRRSF